MLEIRDVCTSKGLNVEVEVSAFHKWVTKYVSVCADSSVKKFVISRMGS